jgi:hypothetical protein
MNWELEELMFLDGITTKPITCGLMGCEEHIATPNGF